MLKKMKCSLTLTDVPAMALQSMPIQPITDDVRTTISEFYKQANVPVPAFGGQVDLRHLCPTLALKIGKNPKLIVFDLDFTLWPFDCDKDVISPYFRAVQGVVDSRYFPANPYPDVPSILATLYDNGIPVAYASRNPSSGSVKELLTTIPMMTSMGEKTLWDALPDRDYFHAYSTMGANKGKTMHFTALKRISGVEYSDMLFFDDLVQNIKYAEEQGTVAILLENRRGLTWGSFLQGLSHWRKVNDQQTRIPS
jgi:magnesium-dependent phosphatase 1